MNLLALALLQSLSFGAPVAPAPAPAVAIAPRPAAVTAMAVVAPALDARAQLVTTALLASSADEYPSTWPRVFEGRATYLLSRMRAKDLVAVALSNLGWTPVDLGYWNKRAVASGLDLLGHSIESYERLLDVPVSVRSADGDRSREVRARLRPWPSIDFVAYANAAGVATELRFETSGSPPPQMVPWHFVADQLTARSETPEIADEWYPRLDLRLRIDAAHLYLRFDFGLLQSLDLDDPKAGGSLPRSARVY